MSEVKIKSIMTTAVETVAPSEPLLSALATMARKSISCLIVVDDKQPVGIFTERDAVKLFGNGHKPAEMVIGDLMNHPVVAIEQAMRLSEAARLMRSKGCRRFPVVDSQNRLVGLITQTDVLRGSLEELEAYSHSLEALVDERTEELRRKNEELEVVSITDALTDLPNRRYLYLRLEEELSRVRRQRVPFGAIMIDIDHFKPVNDQYGHDVGDKVLRECADVMRKLVRKEDLVSRYGGEEFVVMGQGNEANMMVVAERIRKSIAAYQFMVDLGAIRITVSCGVCVRHGEEGLENVDEFLKRADTAMYVAKAKGRNRTEVFDDSMAMAA